MTQGLVYRGRSRVLAILAAGAAAFLLGASGASAAVMVTQPAAHLTWRPASGPVLGYRVQVSRNGGSWINMQVTGQPAITFSAPPGVVLRIRVAAFDAQGTNGPWSLPSRPFQFTGTSTGAGGSGTAGAPTGSTAGGAEVLWLAQGPNARFIQLSRVDGAGVVHLGEAQSLSSDWKIVGSGDFNGDGRREIVWRNSQTGLDAMWFLNGNRKTSAVLIDSEVDLRWQIVGTGDFDGDGRADILWRNQSTGANALWLMNGAHKRAAVLLDPVGDPAWQIVGTGDFDGDGRADILWRNQSTGANALWFMNGAHKRAAVLLDPVADPAWQIVGTGDFDGDGKADILWQKAGSGYVAIWLMNGSIKHAALMLDSVGGPDWRIVGNSDFNGDDKADILWDHISDGRDVISLMNGLRIRKAVALTGVAGSSGALEAVMVVN